MSASVLQGNAPNSLNFEYIFFLPHSNIEEGDILSDSELKALQRDKAFWRIWTGGVLKASLNIKSMVGSDEKGRLMVNGRRFTRSSWGWHPPPIIREQGRLAKEEYTPANEHPEIAIVTQKGEVLWLDACPCGGELLMDHRGVLYCDNCFMIYE